MACCKRRGVVQRYPMVTDAAGVQLVAIPLSTDAVEFTVRVGLAGPPFAPIAFRLRYVNNRATQAGSSAPAGAEDAWLDLLAGEGYQEQHMELDGPITLQVAVAVGPVTAPVAEVVMWEG